MKSDKRTKTKDNKQLYKITEQGSLGLLAFGDLGLRAWRKVKDNAKPKGNEEK